MIKGRTSGAQRHGLGHEAATLMLNRTGSITTASIFLGHTYLRTASVLDDASESASAPLYDVVDGLKPKPTGR
jgi:integrase